MQLCSNDLMEDKACTNRPMTNIGFWNLFQTAIGAATSDIDDPSHQVFMCCLFTQVHAPRGSFLFRAAKLNHMEWFQLPLMGFSSGVALSL